MRAATARTWASQHPRQQRHMAGIGHGDAEAPLRGGGHKVGRTRVRAAPRTQVCSYPPHVGAVSRWGQRGVFPHLGAAQQGSQGVGQQVGRCGEGDQVTHLDLICDTHPIRAYAGNKYEA
jgi:hypothetical protein